ncbi:hypothetical protein N9L68_05905 [bacterium]|nr:hypothetical protein [bacterium]
MVSRHEGERLGERGAAGLRGVGGGPCPSCDGLQAYSSRSCHHCGMSQLARPPRPEDVLAQLEARPTNSRQGSVVYLRNPSTETPRLIRVGEMWRRVIAKRLVHDHRAKLQWLLLEHRQCGLALPGGADVLIHVRRCLEQAAEMREGEAAVLLDLDLRNASPFSEWDAIWAAVEQCFPELRPWIARCHGAAAEI